MSFITLSTGEIIKRSQLKNRSLVITPESGGFVAYYNELPEAISEGSTYEDTMACLNIAVNAISEYRKKQLLKSLCLN